MVQAFYYRKSAQITMVSNKKKTESGLKVSDVGAHGDHCVVTLTFGQRMSSQDGCGSDNKVKQKVVNLRENRKPTATMWLLFYLTGGFA